MNCAKCGLPILYGVASYGGPHCMCHTKPNYDHNALADLLKERDQLKADNEAYKKLHDWLKAENERLHHAYLLSHATLLSLQGQDMVLRKQLNEAMRLLRYSADECIPSLGREIEAWLEKTK